jgi:uncharacterized protein (DUF1015 family)
MKYSAFNTEPVLMTYSDNKTIEKDLSQNSKLADFEFSKREINYLWKIDDVLEIKWIQNVLKNKYIVFSWHHRSAAAALLSEENEIVENTAKIIC